MPDRRIDRATSRTAQWTCVSRAASALEREPHYRSGDHLALSLVPGFLRVLLHVSLVRRFYSRVMAPKGIYEYVIARTKYIDAALKQALADEFDQVLIFGAGFDTRALRFHGEEGNATIFELDVPITQEAKLGQYRKRGLTIPPNVVFIAIDFDKESLTDKLDHAGFERDRRSLFIMEGLLMYLQPESVDQTFRVIRNYAGVGSRVVFDYIYASVLRHENLYYGESDASKTVSGADEQWHFGIEQGEVPSFLSAYGFELSDHKSAQDLERVYFTDQDGRVVGRVNGTHCLVTATKR